MSSSQRDEVSVRRELISLKLNEAVVKVEASIDYKTERMNVTSNASQKDQLDWDRNNLKGKLTGLNEARAIVDAWL